MGMGMGQEGVKDTSVVAIALMNQTERSLFWMSVSLARELRKQT